MSAGHVKENNVKRDNMITNGYILGIDPDVDKSGFALLDCSSRTFVSLETLPFTDAIRFFERLVANNNIRPIRVIIEDSDMSVNWHYDKNDKPGVIAAIGRSVGLCHATYRHLKEYAEALGFQVIPMKPLRKCWRGPDGKITQGEIERLIPNFPKRTNQECRDSALLSWFYADFPLILRRTL